MSNRLSIRLGSLICLKYSPKSLASDVLSVAGSKLTTLVAGDDFPDAGATWPARVGSALIPYSTGRPTIGSLNGRRAPVFAVGPAAQSYVLPVNQTEFWGVARYDGALPFVNYPSIVGGPGGASARLMGSTGTSEMISSGEITRDGVATRATDGLIHVWRSAGTPGADDKQIGAYYTGANSWIGPIGLVMAFGTALTADEAAKILSMIRRYYRISL